MRKISVRKLVLAAVFTGLVTVVTMTFQVPLPLTKGYINVGDSIIFTAAVLLGGEVGLLAGGLGSALADVLSGYPHWAPWTLVIKGIEGFIAGYFGHRKARRTGGLFVVPSAITIAAAWMVFGYYLAAGFMYGFPASLADLPQNIIQGAGSIVIAILLIFALRTIVPRGMD